MRFLQAYHHHRLRAPPGKVAVHAAPERAGQAERPAAIALWGGYYSPWNWGDPLRRLAAGPSVSAFPPIASYGFISDCEVNTLVAPSGNIEWMCVPRPDSPSIFAAVLDRGAGGFRVGPTDRSVPAGHRYLPGTMVLETTWQTASGWLVTRDALVIGRWRHKKERSAV